MYADFNGNDNDFYAFAGRCSKVIVSKHASAHSCQKMSDIFLRNSSHIVFIIGGSLGLSSEVLSLADYHLCFSKMTFPHKLMKLILLEQVYRSFKIINNETYHK